MREERREAEGERHNFSPFPARQAHFQVDLQNFEKDLATPYSKVVSPEKLSAQVCVRVCGGGL